jgi:hypothetical protein
MRGSELDDRDVEREGVRLVPLGKVRRNGQRAMAVIVEDAFP